MSQPSCDACANLRESNANFIMNGVTETVADSLAANTGFNPCLTDLHTDCEDLNDANDCLIGHMDDDLDNFEICDIKDFLHNLLPNLYEMLKAIIASICGLWTKTEKIESKVENICTAMNSSKKPHYIKASKNETTDFHFYNGAAGTWWMAMWLFDDVTVNCDTQATSHSINKILLTFGSESDAAFVCENLSWQKPVASWSSDDVKPYVSDFIWSGIVGKAGFMQPVATVGSDGINRAIMTMALVRGDGTTNFPDTDRVYAVVYSCANTSGAVDIIQQEVYF